MKKKLSFIILFVLVFNMVMAGIVVEANSVRGDLDGNGTVNRDDAIYLLYHTMLPEKYPVNQDVDFDDNGYVTSDDAIYLLNNPVLPETDDNEGDGTIGGDITGDDGNAGNDSNTDSEGGTGSGTGTGNGGSASGGSSSGGVDEGGFGGFF